LGKLHVSPGSSEDKLRETYNEVSIAVEEGLCTDTTSRNSLYKIHVSLGKIVNALDEQQQQQQHRTSLRASTRSATSAATERQQTEERTVAGEPQIKEEDTDDTADFDDDIMEEDEDPTVRAKKDDSLTEALLGGASVDTAADGD
jgi:condensin complex subunit 3